jgi:peptidoglycan hydrolase-like protein with peptidoglycan-binding domain
MRLVPAALLLSVLAACAGGSAPESAGIHTTIASVVRADIARTQSVSGTISYGDAVPIVLLGAGGVVTWLPAAGSVVRRGQRLFAVNGQGTYLMAGPMPAFRSMTLGTSGADVRQLEQNLIALGYANHTNLVANGHFTAADAAAVRRWQRAVGLQQTGVVSLGAVVFATTALRVGSLRVTQGSPVGPGTPILDATRTDVHVNVPLDTTFIAFVHRGDAVRVVLPDLATTLSGRVTSVATTATVAGGPNQPQRPTVAVRVDVNDTARMQGYDQAPVQVAITLELHRNVLAVPVLALLAEPDQKYAVRLVRGSTRTLVEVQPGLQDAAGLIEITNAGLAAGDQVEVPAE